jgi:ABC-type cobalt transport system substrate-binding protein
VPAECRRSSERHEQHITHIAHCTNSEVARVAVFEVLPKPSHEGHPPFFAHLPQACATIARMVNPGIESWFKPLSPICSTCEILMFSCRAAKTTTSAAQLMSFHIGPRRYRSHLSVVDEGIELSMQCQASILNSGKAVVPSECTSMSVRFGMTVTSEPINSISL